MSAASKSSIVFVHGLWADGSCFSKVIPSLRAAGVLGVQRFGFYAFMARADRRATRSVQDDRLMDHIRQIHRDTTGTYGSPRVSAELLA
jgi:hypothetical protein